MTGHGAASSGTAARIPGSAAGPRYSVATSSASARAASVSVVVPSDSRSKKSFCCSSLSVWRLTCSTSSSSETPSPACWSALMCESYPAPLSINLDARYGRFRRDREDGDYPRSMVSRGIEERLSNLAAVIDVRLTKLDVDDLLVELLERVRLVLDADTA